MKKTFLLLLITWISSATFAMDYTIAFYQSVIDTLELSNDKINSTDNCVRGERNALKIGKGPAGFGIKGGTADVKGQITLQLDTIYHITQMTVYAAAYSHKKDTAEGKGMSVCGDTIYWAKDYKTVIRPYSIDIDSQTDSIQLSSLIDSYNRWYVQRIEFTADDPRPGTPKITAPLSVDLGSAILIDGQPASDVFDITILARCTTDSLSLSFKKGKYFSLNSTKLPPSGGVTNLTYTVTEASDGGYTIKDSLIIVAHGTDQNNVRHAVYVHIFAKNHTSPSLPVDSSCMRIGKMPGDYYQPAQGLRDSALKAALSEVIHCGPRYRYGSGRLHSWNGFFFTDRDTMTHEVLDMYSNNIRYFDLTDTCGSVAGFDIEHMLPKSWWGGDVNEAYCDLFHLVPADYSANRSKSNHAPGIPADSSFNNGSFVTGSGEKYGLTRVFCPADEYKGDFARAYFYIVTCYDTLHWVTTGEPGKSMTNDSYLEFQPWLQELLMSWHRLDPVSDKEKARAIEVNKIQGNRNPFIDFPELAEYIWGNKQGVNVNFYNLIQSFGDPYEDSSAISEISLSLDEPLQKILLRDQVLIYKDGELYTLQGQ